MDISFTVYFVKNIGMSQILSSSITTVMGMEESEFTKQILIDWDVK